MDKYSPPGAESVACPAPTPSIKPRLLSASVVGPSQRYSLLFHPRHYHCITGQELVLLCTAIGQETFALAGEADGGLSDVDLYDEIYAPRPLGNRDGDS